MVREWRELGLGLGGGTGSGVRGRRSQRDAADEALFNKADDLLNAIWGILQVPEWMEEGPPGDGAGDANGFGRGSPQGSSGNSSGGRQVHRESASGRTSPHLEGFRFGLDLHFCMRQG